MSKGVINILIINNSTGTKSNLILLYTVEDLTGPYVSCV